MTVQLEQKNRCDNLNHRRVQAMVRHCPSCGHLLNGGVQAGRCGDAAHATARRQRVAFCSDCGLQLIANG
jgi:ribosomal protein L37AE/L43A